MSCHAGGITHEAHALIVAGKGYQEGVLLFTTNKFISINIYSFQYSIVHFNIYIYIYIYIYI